MRQLRLTAVAVLTIVFCLGLATSALAGEILDAAVSSLRTNDVYVDPSMQSTVGPGDAKILRDQIATSPTPIYIAVLPNAAKAEAGGSADGIPRLIGQRLGTGTVVVIAGNSFRAGSSVLPRGEAGSLATQVFNSKRSAGAVAVLTEYVSRVKNATRNAGNTAASRQAAAQKSDKGFPAWAVVLLVLLGLSIVGIGAWVLVSRSNRKKKVEVARTVADSKVSALGNKVVEYSSVVDSRISEAGERYNWASARLNKAETIGDLEEVAKAAEAGLRLIRSYEGVEEPAHVEKEVVYAGTERRQDEYEGSRYYEGGYHGGTWYGAGYYPGDFMSGMLWGSMMSRGGYGYGGGYDRDDDDDRGGDQSDNSGGGDWSSSGGGDYGGGGGDWGGGGSSDSGGGDFGGGGGGDYGGGGGGDFGGGDSGGGGGGDF